MIGALRPLLGLIVRGTWQLVVAGVVALGLVMAQAVPTISADASGPQATSAVPQPYGYWLAASDGGIFNFGAPFHGSAGGTPLNNPIVAIAATPDEGGYYLVASDGGVFPFGDARYHGSTGNVPLNRPVVGMAVDPATGGYWLVASDGGVFNFDAPFYGSTGNVHLNRPIVGIVSTPDGGGYFLVASDGGIFPFGDAQFRGSTGSVRLNKPIVGMALDGATGGYWLVASDGGVFNFDAPFLGSTGGVPLNRPIVGMAASPEGAGYYLVASDGGIFNFGVPFEGSTGGTHLNRPIVAMAVWPNAAAQCWNRPAQVPGDAYSPPCKGFVGYNGGATAKGVSGQTITAAFRLTSLPGYQSAFAQLAGAALNDTNADIEQTVQALARYFNVHYQFYGRQLRVVFYAGTGNPADELLGQDLSQAGADATTVGERIGAFADLTAESEPYADALSKKGVVALGEPFLSAGWLAAHAPFGWSVQGDGTTAAADYALARLCPAGTAAAYAGGTLKNAPRKFAIVIPGNSWYLQSAQAAQAYLQSHGCAASLETYALDLATLKQQAADLVGTLQSGNYTTIICGCDAVFNVYFGGQAAQKAYLPEVVIGATGQTDQDYVAQLWSQTFAAHVIGVSGSTAPEPFTQSPGYLAYRSVSSGRPSPFVNQIYEQMQQLAIGIQMAGPDLTPDTFERGMFTYPGRSGPDGLWKFGPSQFTAPVDLREICWNPSVTSPVDGKPGSYVGTSSARWDLGAIPHGPPGCPIPG